jgi:hypothetical protein
VDAVAFCAGMGIAREAPEEIDGRLTGRRIFQRRNNHDVWLACAWSNATRAFCRS